MILQTFLLIINSDRDRIKSQIWHMTLSTILERKQHHSSKNMFDIHYINDWESDQRRCWHHLRWRSYEKVSFYYHWIHDELWRTDFNYEHKEESAVSLSVRYFLRKERISWISDSHVLINSLRDRFNSRKKMIFLKRIVSEFISFATSHDLITWLTYTSV